MRALVGIGALSPPPGGAAVTIGTFDGVHLGHQALIARTRESARELGASSVVVTWDRHPAATLRPEAAPPLLTTPARKVELLKGTGVDVIAVIPFDKELSKWAPERFVTDVLVKGLGAKAVLVGHDWRFGAKAKGDVPLLTSLGEGAGFEVQGIDLQTSGGRGVSSSRVRQAVAAGAMEEAASLLGRPFELEGPVVVGDSRGKSLGYPTANVALDPALAHPPTGVYACVAHAAGSTRPAAVNVGVNPTFGGADRPRVEAYILDFEQDLYGQTIRIELRKRLRDEKRFDSPDDLISQMARDVEETRAFIEA